MNTQSKNQIFNESDNSEQTMSYEQTNNYGKQKNNSGNGKAAAAAAGGFVVGAAAGAATGVMASNHEVEANAEDIENLENKTPETPEPEDVILANDEGIRFAHVEADNFEDAFAQARQQVGPGGAFEYNGKIYGTYYADEWNNMSNEERADYQSRVSDVAPTHHSSATHHAAPTHMAQTHQPMEHPETRTPEVPNNQDQENHDPASHQVRVLNVEAIQNEDGSIMNVALLENGGDHALMVDVDNDGMMEVFVHDDNYDGQIQENEVHDIADAGIHVNDLLAAQAAQEGDYLAASDDGMPDYINDADVSMEI